MSVTIFHNPACGTSRNVLAMIRASGEEPVVMASLKGWRFGAVGLLAPCSGGRSFPGRQGGGQP